MRTGIAVGLGLVVAVVASEAFAQGPATSLGGLQQVVNAGDRITVRDMSGLEVTGTLSTLSSTSLTLLVDDRRRDWQEAEIAVVYRRHPDSLANGVGWGAVAGFVTSVVIIASIYDEGYDEWAINRAVAAAIGAGAGAAIGAGVDAAHVGRRAIFERPVASGVSLAVRGLRSPTRLGAVVSVGF